MFAGDGNFINDLRAHLQTSFPGKQFHYELIDKDGASTRDAQNLFKDAPDVDVHPPTGIVGISDLSGFLKAAPHIVTILGGLNNEVISTRSAKIIAARIYNILAEDGLLIVTGRSLPLLTAEDFKKLGFDVLNTMLPGGRESLYILRKPADASALNQELAARDGLHFAEAKTQPVEMTVDLPENQKAIVTILTRETQDQITDVNVQLFKDGEKIPYETITKELTVLSVDLEKLEKGIPLIIARTKEGDIVVINEASDGKTVTLKLNRVPEPLPNPGDEIRVLGNLGWVWMCFECLPNEK